MDLTFCIRIDYITGGSFSRYNDSDVIPLVWRNIDIVKENLTRIKEHNELYKELNNHRSIRTRDSIINENKDKDWFCDEDTYEYESYLKLKLDDGTYSKVEAFWVGYFETILKAYAVINEDELEINFN